MSDQFDKKLINRINEAFDNFEDGSIDEGWQKLREQYPEQKKQRRAIWWFSSAAALLLLAGIWLLSDNNNELIEKRAARPTIQKVMAGDSLQEARETTKNPLNQHSTETTGNINSISSPLKQNALLAKRKPSKYNRRAINSKRQPANQTPETKAEHDLAVMVLTQNMQLGKEDSTASKTGALASADGVVGTKAQALEDSRVYPSEVISKEDLARLISNTTPEKVKKEKRHRIAFFAGSYFTYADGSEASMNTGAGVSSEFKLTRKLKLATGVSLGQNSLKYNQSIPREAAMSLNKAMLDQGSASFESLNDIVSNSSGALRQTINSYDASLLGFDIPVNLKYTVLQRKNSIYVSSGLSSNIFIKESYTYGFNFGSKSFKEQENLNSAKSFNFARVLNLSLGFEHPFNNKTVLSVEPFIKYPLSGLGTQDLRFRAAGMNLKFNFNR